MSRGFIARVAELVDALDLGSSGHSCGGSSPPSRTTYKRYNNKGALAKLRPLYYWELKKIFESGELNEKVVCSISEHTSQHGANEGKYR